MAAPRSFRGRLLLLVLLAALAAVVVQSGIVRTLEVLEVRPSALAELAPDAEVIATHSAAPLAFGDAEAAEETLAALRAAPRVVSATIFDAEGAPFATYRRQDANALPPGPIVDAHRFEGGRLVLGRRIEHDGEALGSLRMVYDLSGYYAAIWRKCLIAIGVAGVAVGVSMLAAMRLQRRLTGPLAVLATASRRVSASRDYSVRVPRGSMDEVGELTDAFNEMLATIEARDADLLKTQRELTATNQQLQQFAYVASHDLQEPLRKIQTFASLLNEDFASVLPDEGRNYLERMGAAATRMRGLITALLNYSRIGSKDPELSDVPLGDVLQGVLSDLEVRLGESGGSVRVEALPVVHADETHMRQLFQNLVGNALKFHRPGLPPRVVLASERQDGPRGTHTWRITVRDNGIGFEQAYADRIFMPFQRLHGRDEYEGTGMGLAVCKRIADRYGWGIAAASRPGEGTTFTITIPGSATGSRAAPRENAAGRGAAA